MEFVRQYLLEGARVIATIHTSDGLAAMESLSSRFPQQLRILSIDLTDWPAVAALPDKLSGEHIDLLINNAGIRGDGDQHLGNLAPENWLEVLAINAIAPAKLTEVMTTRLAEKAIIVFISSDAASLAENNKGGNYYYRTSKTLLNAIGKNMAVDFAGEFTVLMLHPGWVRTRLGGASALLDVETSVNSMRRVLSFIRPEDNGRFLRYDGKALPW